MLLVKEKKKNWEIQNFKQIGVNLLISIAPVQWHMRLIYPKALFKPAGMPIGQTLFR